MKPMSGLFTFALVAGLAACGPTEDDPGPGALSFEATLEAPIPDSLVTGLDTETETAAANPLTLTGFTPFTDEIYCSFYNIGDNGLRGERVFITAIAGVPAPAHVGLQGQAVMMTQISKSDDASPEVWLFENAGRGLQLRMQVTETAKGLESRDFEGTMQVTGPVEGPETAIAGTCGV